MRRLFKLDQLSLALYFSAESKVPSLIPVALKDRIARSTSIPPSANLIPDQGRPSNYKNWDESTLHCAYQAVIDGLTVRRAAELYSVPKSTLQDRVSGRVLFGATSGPPKYLTNEEEDELANFLSGSAAVGYARTKKEIIALVQQVVDAKKINRVVTEGWWASFNRRYGNLTLRTAEKLSYVRAVASNPDILDHYYSLLQKTLLDNDLMEKPTNIFNLDETGMPLDPDPPKVIANRGAKHPTTVSSGEKSQITVLARCNAAGYVLPPMVVFDRKSLKKKMATGVPGTLYGLSQKGWMDAELFDTWFTHHFLVHAPPSRPLLLLMDGHSSHFNPSTISKAAEESVIIFCLPPHTTHLTQPLDKGCFGPLKMCWREECKKYLSDNPGRVITRFQFSELFGRAWMRGMSMKNVIAGFHTTGIFPFNRHALRTKDVTSKFDPSSLSKTTGLKYIPLYSPVRRSLAPLSPSTPTEPVFTTQATTCFERRFSEGYDLKHDERYNLWLKTFHPEELSAHAAGLAAELFPNAPPHPSTKNATKRSDQVCLIHSTVLSKLLPPGTEHTRVKFPKIGPKTSARVVTSYENLNILQEKQRKKEEEAQKKEECRLERRRKKEEKERKKEAARLKRQMKNSGKVAST